MKKYIKLIIKDLVVYKNIFSLIFSFIVCSNIIFLIVPQINEVLSFNELTILVVSCFLILYKLEEEKSKGTEFLLTTSYTRKDIILARYLIVFFIVILEFMTYLTIIITVSGNITIFEIKNSLIGFLYVCIYMSLLIPLSFKFSTQIISTFMAITLAFIWYLKENSMIKQFMFIFDNNFSLFFISIIFILSTFIITSIFVCKKIYLEKDL